MAQTADVERAAIDSHPRPPTPVSEEVKHADCSKKDSAEVRPGTPNSIGNDLDFSHNREVSESSVQHSPPTYSASTRRKPVPVSISQGNGRGGSEVRLQEAPASPVSISPAHVGILDPERASILMDGDSDSHPTSTHVETPDSASGRLADSIASLPIRSRDSNAFPEPQRASFHPGHNHSRQSSSTHMQPRINEEGEDGEGTSGIPEAQDSPGLHYHAFPESTRAKPSHRASQMTTLSTGSSSSGGGEYKQAHLSTHSRSASHTLNVPHQGLSRPASSYTPGTELRGRTLSPLSANGSDPDSPHLRARDLSSQRRSPLGRPPSYVELLANVPYNQQVAPAPPLNNVGLQSVVGSAASLLDTKKTLDMYRANVKKTKDAAVQYEFAIFMLNAARDAEPGDDLDPTELQVEAKHILQTLSDRAYPFAQYYLADGYFSGLFHKGKPDYDKAFPLFVAASKHGHAEAGYRAALCYEFGWGTARSGPKAVQFYKASASKNHPGAATRLGLACLNGDMGLDARVRQVYRDGVKWLKRAQESADPQYNQGPYELGLLHLEGDGNDIFKDEAYAAQLLTQAAELGHVQANFMMGQAYENGLYGCPRDAALSVHFYNGAATRGHVEGMMALCAWYMVGAEPVLERDEHEAYAWAKMAAETGWAKAEYAIGYFTEMGIGCRRDPLEANVWYVRAADQGNETAKQRLAIIRQAASGDPGIPMAKGEAKSKDLKAGDKKKRIMGIF
ncbi:hypothetical protein AC579_1127 [Pseudocercospora musae]|uniref:HCP-like protein n=1 Tax=Pseudocercospora musae TaxID=113226 RepID=A0A139HPZ5_9PEZI|nr:hypothetical protein AC579_1127 [Pseudocercospora musae]